MLFDVEGINQRSECIHQVLCGVGQVDDLNHCVLDT